ncbi:hypothetical protein HZF08_22380 [Paenibacillus sp. CGMCC 1.16610]|uniref:DUF2019 domain-containing protein n=1 Tax=Paenibacillus anseongense TaxID=2682845 RepID=A0ABW9UKI7_9BACL|nr:MULTISPECIES: hypothetical protein [Paenibacillus]MBA2941035.1 hypothetical protein [Paenibacillus sp. CGMCC 1.16610]MVQ39856.1 hypothetical protein [Paenibacillus anseongense]
MSSIQELIVNNIIRAAEKIAGNLYTHVETDHMKRFESEISFGLFNSVGSYERSKSTDLAEEIKSLKALYDNRGQKMLLLTYSYDHDEAIEQALSANDMKPVEVIYGQGLLLEGWHSEAGNEWSGG